MVPGASAVADFVEQKLFDAICVRALICGGCWYAVERHARFPHLPEVTVPYCAIAWRKRGDAPSAEG
jgi:hypothetical protein